MLRLPTTELYSDLLDFTPASIDEARQLLLPGYFTDPVLRPGQTWRDPFSDLTIEVMSMTPERLRVAVRYDLPCTSVSGIAEGAVISTEGRPTPISVTAGPECSWSATTSRSWVDVPGGLNRKGSATVTLEAQQHSSALPRHAAVTIERKTFAVMQSGPAAKPSVTSFGPNRGSFESLTWIPTETIVTDANGTGDLKEFFILINETQSEMNGCLARYDFATRTLALKVPTTNEYSIDTIRNGEWDFASNSRCGAGYPSVTAISDTEVSVWMDFAFVPSVSRPQEIYTMAVDRSGATTGWVRQGSFSFDRVCRVVPRPFRSTVGAGAGLYGFEVVPTSEPCPWQVSSASPWIKVETGSSGNEFDLVLYSVEANPGPGPRTGSLTLGEYTLQVIQADPRAIRLSDFVVSPAETTVSSGRGLVSISVRAAGKAEWQITTTAPWLSVLDKGSDFVTLTHLENTTSSERRATTHDCGTRGSDSADGGRSASTGHRRGWRCECGQLPDRNFVRRMVHRQRSQSVTHDPYVDRGRLRWRSSTDQP